MRLMFCILMFCPAFSGCVKRTISIQSNPEGALVWVNDREVGRTPLEIGFLYYGEYDVRLEKDGFEPIMTTRWASAPLWDAPVIDVAGEMFSRHAESRVEWRFALPPRDDDPVELVDRAAILRYALKSGQP